MPIYEYQCGDCGHRLEKLQKMSDQPLTHCPECAEPALKKMMSASAFRLKGGGWYETDFKSGNKKNIVGDNSETKGKESAESKPAKDSPAKDSPAKSDSKAASAAASG